MDIFEPNTSIDPNVDHYAELVGEGKKYKTNADAARAILEKDAFIKRVLDEKRVLEEDLKTRVNMQDFLDQVKTPVERQPQAPAVTTQPQASASALTPDDLERRIQQQIVQREADVARSRNLLTVQGRLQETLGQNYSEHVKRRATDLGLDIQYFNDTAARSPQAFFELMGLNQPREQLTSLPRSTSNPPVSVSGGKKFADFNRMRKENPVQYHSQAVQKEMWELARQLGPDFYT